MDRYLELASEFRDRFILFHLCDGTVRDSRLINWRRVEWDRVVALEAFLRGHRHRITCEHARFKFFLNFKIHRFESLGAGEGVDRRWWVIGWTDGETAFLRAIDFATGKLDFEYRQPLRELAAHIHPKCQGMVAGNIPGTYSAKELGL